MLIAVSHNTYLICLSTSENRKYLVYEPGKKNLKIEFQCILQISVLHRSREVNGVLRPIQSCSEVWVYRHFEI